MGLRCGAAAWPSSIREAGLLREGPKVPVVELWDSACESPVLTPSFVEGFGLEVDEVAEEVMLIFDREASASGPCGFGVEDREGFEDSASFLFSSDFAVPCDAVPSFARRRARIYLRLVSVIGLVKAQRCLPRESTLLTCLLHLLLIRSIAASPRRMLIVGVHGALSKQNRVPGKMSGRKVDEAELGESFNCLG